ncbi:MAG TPA: hypothetical protein EYQ54_15530, partial [Myxococcales bacterium]|nr:hypothetical protein [Myxococcales bacterium]
MRRVRLNRIAGGVLARLTPTLAPTLALALPLALLACTEAPAPEAGPGRVAGWPAWGGEPGGGHYSLADQITPTNVHGLELAWVHNSGDI